MTELQHIEKMLEQLYDWGYQIIAAFTSGKNFNLAISYIHDKTFDGEITIVADTIYECLQEAVELHNQSGRPDSLSE